MAQRDTRQLRRPWNGQARRAPRILRYPPLAAAVRSRSRRLWWRRHSQNGDFQDLSWPGGRARALKKPATGRDPDIGLVPSHKSGDSQRRTLGSGQACQNLRRPMNDHAPHAPHRDTHHQHSAGTGRPWDGLITGCSLATLEADAGYGTIQDGALAWTDDRRPTNLTGCLVRRSRPRDAKSQRRCYKVR